MQYYQLILTVLHVLHETSMYFFISLLILMCQPLALSLFGLENIK